MDPQSARVLLLNNADNDLEAAGDVQLLVDAPQVRVNRMGRNPEITRNLCFLVVVKDVPHNLQLARRERERRSDPLPCRVAEKTLACLIGPRTTLDRLDNHGRRFPSRNSSVPTHDRREYRHPVAA
jgi:hypothetical protein